MRNPSAIVITGALALAIAAAPAALAKGPGGGGPPGLAGGSPPGFGSAGLRTGWGGANHPPGWSRGQKRGWINGSCTTARLRAGLCKPPGLR
jgi:hypothetical protein